MIEPGAPGQVPKEQGVPKQGGRLPGHGVPKGQGRPKGAGRLPGEPGQLSKGAPGQLDRDHPDSMLPDAPNPWAPAEDTVVVDEPAPEGG